MKLLALSIETLVIEIENQERLMESYKEQDNYGKMCGQYHYLDGLHRALLLVRWVYAANDIEHLDKGLS